MTFYGSDSSKADWVIPSDGLDGFGAFTNSFTTVNNAIGDGSILSSTRIAQKDRTIKAVSRSIANNDTLRAQAIEFFAGKHTYKIYLTYMGVTRWCEGKIYKFELPSENVNKHMHLQVTFMCTNPYMKSYDDFGKDIASISGMAGFPFLCAAERSYHVPQGTTSGIYNFSQTVVLSNDGDTAAGCRVIIQASGTVENPKVTINGHYVRVLDELEAGDRIEIDFTANPPTVRKNDVNILGKCDRTSAFDEMELQIGDNTAAFDADNGSDNMAVSIYYNKLYTAI